MRRIEYETNQRFRVREAAIDLQLLRGMGKDEAFAAAEAHRDRMDAQGLAAGIGLDAIISTRHNYQLD